jgi:hypothetical protein
MAVNASFLTRRVIMTDDKPEIKDQPGPWDELVNRAILLAFVLSPLAFAAYLIGSGGISFGEIVIEGTIPVRPFAIGYGALVGLVILLAIMKFYGLAPVAWLLEKAHNAAKNYNPDD